MLSRSRVVFLSVLALTGCPADDELPADRLLRVTLDAPEIIEIGGDYTESITAHVTYADDGSPASGYTFSVHADCKESSRCTIIVPASGTGTETILFHGNDYITGFLFARAKLGEYTEPADSEKHYYVVLPDGGKWLQAAVTEVRLAPGEQRPVAGLAHSSGGPTGRWQSATRPNYSVDDPSIATVDSFGVVTGVDAGTTTLRLELAGLTATADVIVDGSLVMGLPPEGIGELSPVRAIGDLFQLGGGSRRPAHGLVVDSRGYPFAVARLGTAAVLVGWTGTGYGTEMLPDGFDYTGSAYLTIDGRDRLYVITSGQFGITRVYDRAASAIGPSSWKRRVLDYHVATFDEAGASWTDYLFSTPDSSISLLPNRTDGFELVYRLIADGRPIETEHDCAGIYRFATVTAESVAVADIAFDWFDLPAGGPCDQGTRPVWNTFALLRGSDGSTQFVLPNGNRAQGAPESYWLGSSIYTRDLAGAWSTPPGIPNMNGGHFPVPTEGYSVDALDLGFAMSGAPIASELYEGLGSVTLDAPYLFADSGRTWIGKTLLGPLGLFRPDGTSTFDSNAIGFWRTEPSGLENENWTVLGAKAVHHRMHVLATESIRENALEILTLDIPPVARTEAPEAEGRLAFGTGPNGRVFAPDVVLANGVRVALAADATGVHVHRSAGVDAPWTQLADTAVLSSATPLVESGGVLYAFDVAGVLQRSSDRGATFVPATAPTTEAFGATPQLVVGPAGAVFDLGTKLVYARFNASAATSPFASVTLALTAPDGGTIDAGASRRILVDATGFTLLAQSIIGTPPPTIYLARYTWAGALSSETVIGNRDGESYEQLLLADGEVASDGSLVFMGARSTLGHFVLRGHHLDLTTGIWSATTLGTTFTERPTNVLALGDGRLAVGVVVPDTTSAIAFRVHRRIFVTADGANWSAGFTPPSVGGHSESLQRLLRDGSNGMTTLLLSTDRLSGAQPDVPYVQRVVVP